MLHDFSQVNVPSYIAVGSIHQAGFEWHMEGVSLAPCAGLCGHITEVSG